LALVLFHALPLSISFMHTYTGRRIGYVVVMINIPKDAPEFEDAMEMRLYKRLKVDPVVDH
nr:hypothetical protein [Tanacetum cinerariifolium]